MESEKAKAIFFQIYGQKQSVIGEDAPSKRPAMIGQTCNASVGSILATEVRASGSESLGRYSSLFSLQCFDRLSLIALGGANGVDAVVKASKLELLVQLDGKFVDLNFGGLLASKHTHHFDGDGSSVGLASWSTESHHDGVDFLRVSNDVTRHSQGHRECTRGLSLDFLFNRDGENLDGHLSSWLLVSKSERATLLPWPVGVVKDFDVNDLSGTGCKLDDTFGLFGADSTSGFPIFLAVKVPVLVTAIVVAELLAKLLHLFLELGVVAKVAHELMHHVLEAATATSTAAMTSAATTTSTTSWSELLDHLLDKV